MRVYAVLVPLCGAMALFHAPAQAQSGPREPLAWPPELERCLIERLRTAVGSETVASVRSACGLDAGAAPPSVSLDSDTEPASATGAPAVGPVEGRIASEGRLWSERFALLPHRPNYLHPFSWAFDSPTPRSDLEATQRAEIKFQISFKLPLTRPLFDGRAALFFAYTGQSWWQAYNSAHSSPFREYNHEPEVFAAWRPTLSLLGWNLRVAALGFVHRSNGRSVPYSRSWNRIAADLVFDRPGNYWFALRPWWRIPESAKSEPSAPDGDDNPDITRFLGHGELRFGYASGDHNWTFMLRRALSDGGRGALQLDYSYPTRISPQLRWHVQYFDGYGESLIDYRTRIRRLGIGLMLNDWF